MKKIFTLICLLVTINTIDAQTISYSTAGSNYTENFDGLITTGITNNAANGPFEIVTGNFAGSTVAGWYVERFAGSTAGANFSANDGTGNSGSVFSYGTGTATERALGLLASGSRVNRMGVLITNNTGAALSSVTISFNNELWRRGTNATGNIVAFSYKTGATAINDATGYTVTTNLNLVTPNLTGAEGSRDGNNATYRTAVTFTLTGISWAPGDVLGLRWDDANETGNDDGMSIDDFSFTAGASVTPTLTAGPAITGLSTTLAVASASQSFNVSGTSLTGAPGNIAVTAASTDIQVSLSSGSGFGSTVNVPYTSATLAATQVYARISATAPLGALSSTVTVSGGGAPNIMVNVSGNVLAAEPTTQATNVLLTNLANNGMDINWTNGNGTNRLVVIRQTMATEFPPTDAATYTANTDIASAGTTGGGNYVVYNGSATGPVSVTGLTAGTSYTVTVYEFNGGAGSANYLTAAATGNPATASTTGISPNLTQVNFTALAAPLYTGTGTTNRTPTMFYARLSNLTPNTTYRYYTQAAVASDLGTTGTGAGNAVLIDYTVSPVTYTYSAAVSLSIAGGYGKFTTNASGSFAGSFGFVNTGNAKFTAGNILYPTIALSVDPATTTLYRFALDQTITALAFAATSGATDGTFIQGTSSATPGNIVGLWSNTTATGRPLSMTLAENPTIATGNGGAAWGTSFITGYDLTAGSWNTIIPNNNANGVRLAQQFDIVTGTVLGCNSDADGTWPTGSVVTANPTGGTTPLQISSTDAPLNSGSCFSILPIKLEYIKGQKTNSGIALNWKVTCTSTQIVMEIERSAVARNFAPINSIAATQARCAQPFDFIDATPLQGRNYYRLKMIDIDGKVSYSPILVIINGSKGFEFVGIYPSIVKNETSLSISSAKAATIETRITDMSGRVVAKSKQSIPAGASLIKIDCGNLAPGIYNLTGIAPDATSSTIRFVKL